MIKGVILKLYPYEVQRKKLALWCNHTRGLWNLFVRQEKEQYKKDNKFLWCKDLQTSLPGLKKEHTWIGELPACSSQMLCLDMEKALKGMKQGKRFPKFKKKRWGTGSIYFSNGLTSTRFQGKMVRLAKLGWIKFRGNLPEGRLLGGRVIKNGDDFFLSVQFECEKPKPVPYQVERIGVDLGVKDAAVIFDGKEFEHVAAPGHLRKAEALLKKRQRVVSRRKKGSNRRLEAIRKVHALHQKIARRRKDFQHKLTHGLITKAGEISMETLNVKGMARNHHLAKSVSDAGLGEIGGQLDYKAGWYGRTLIKASPWFASSQICSRCGHKNVAMKNLAKRLFECEVCGLTLGRDENAAVNLWYGEERRNLTGVEMGGQDSSAGCLNPVPVGEAPIVSHLVELPSA